MPCAPAPPDHACPSASRVPCVRACVWRSVRVMCRCVACVWPSTGGDDPAADGVLRFFAGRGDAPRIINAGPTYYIHVQPTVVRRLPARSSVRLRPTLTHRAASTTGWATTPQSTASLTTTSLSARARAPPRGPSRPVPLFGVQWGTVRLCVLEVGRRRAGTGDTAATNHGAVVRGMAGCRMCGTFA